MMPGSSITRTITITAVMIAFVFVVTYFLSFPLSFASGQYFDAGDIAVFIVALTFGPAIGGISGGVGSALSDVAIPGSGYFAPFTLIIKGLEGFLAGYLATRRFRYRDLLGWSAGSILMVFGYFLTNFYLVGLIFGAGFAQQQGLGLTAALSEFPFDVVQVVAGGVVGIPVARRLKARLPKQFLPGVR